MQLKRKYGFEVIRRFSKKDLGEVYLAEKQNKKIVVKIQKDLVNYKRETEALRLLNGKAFQAPVMLECGIIDGQTGYFIEEFFSGKTLLSVYQDYDPDKRLALLREAGELLGGMNTLFTEKELEESGLWKYAYSGALDFKDYRWIHLYQDNISQWLEVIARREGKEGAFFTECAAAVEAAFERNGGRGKMGLLHRDFGFRNIMIEKDHVRGVIDFEYAVPGDIVFDLSKLIFNDLDFERDLILRDAFFAGWEEACGQTVDWNRLWLYLAVQGLGAVQWVDRQEDARVRMENADYREKGILILREACERLRRV